MVSPQEGHIRTGVLSGRGGGRNHNRCLWHPCSCAMASSGLWVIGLFIGIDLIFYGAAWIGLALGLRAGS